MNQNEETQNINSSSRKLTDSTDSSDSSDSSEQLPTIIINDPVKSFSTESILKVFPSEPDKNDKTFLEGDFDETFKICRFCQETFNKKDMIVPCSCTSPSKWVHRSCLKNYMIFESNQEAKIKCLECGKKYEYQYRPFVKRILSLLFALFKIIFNLSVFSCGSFFVSGLLGLWIGLIVHSSHPQPLSQIIGISVLVGTFLKILIVGSWMMFGIIKKCVKKTKKDSKDEEITRKTLLDVKRMESCWQLTLPCTPYIYVNSFLYTFGCCYYCQKCPNTFCNIYDYVYYCHWCSFLNCAPDDSMDITHKEYKLMKHCENSNFFKGFQNPEDEPRLDEEIKKEKQRKKLISRKMQRIKNKKDEEEIIQTIPYSMPQTYQPKYTEIQIKENCEEEIGFEIDYMTNEEIEEVNYNCCDCTGGCKECMYQCKFNNEVFKKVCKDIWKYSLRYYFILCRKIACLEYDHIDSTACFWKVFIICFSCLTTLKIIIYSTLLAFYLVGLVLLCLICSLICYLYLFVSIITINIKFVINDINISNKMIVDLSKRKEINFGMIQEESNCHFEDPSTEKDISSSSSSSLSEQSKSLSKEENINSENISIENKQMGEETNMNTMDEQTDAIIAEDKNDDDNDDKTNVFSDKLNN